MQSARSRLPLPIALAIAAFVMLATACGDGPASEALQPSESPTPAPTATPTESPFAQLPPRDFITPNTVAEKELARQFLPALDQFPPAWRELSSGVAEEPPEATPSTDQGACPTPTLSGQTGAAFATYQNWDANHYVSWSTQIFASEDEASRYLSDQAQLKPAIVDCLIAQIDGGTFCFDNLDCRAGAEGTPRGAPTHHPTTQFRVTFDWAAWAVADQPDLFLTGHLDATVVQVGRSVTTLSHLSFRATADPSATLDELLARSTLALETELPPP